MKIKDLISDALKGFAIGLIVTIPGFSIGTLAIILNIYERLINDFSEMPKHPLQIIKKDLFLGLGFILGFIIDVIALSYLLEHFPMQTVCLFVGLVMSSIPTTISNGIIAKQSKLFEGKLTKEEQLKNENIKVKNYKGEIIACVIALGILIGVTLLNSSNTHEISISFLYLFTIFLCGIISSVFMMIPGISGSLIILALGYYDCVIKSLKGFGECIVNGNFTNFWPYTLTIIFFLIGTLLGLVLISKLIQKLLSKCASYVYFTILGLIIGSPFSIIVLTSANYPVRWDHVIMYIVSFIMMSIGFAIGLGSNYLENKNNKNNE